jgi:hypothetical protein
VREGEFFTLSSRNYRIHGSRSCCIICFIRYYCQDSQVQEPRFCGQQQPLLEYACKTKQKSLTALDVTSSKTFFREFEKFKDGNSLLILTIDISGEQLGLASSFHAWTMDKKIEDIFLVRPFCDDSEPSFFFQLSSLLFGGVKSMQIINQQSKTFLSLL